MFFLLYSLMSASLMSWEDAEKLCQKVQGHLPSVTSADDLSILKNLILGSRFGSNRIPFRGPSLYTNKIMVFIGLRYYVKVSCIHLSNKFFLDVDTFFA